MFREHTKSHVPSLPVLLTLITSMTGCATLSPNTPPSVGDYIPKMVGQQAPANQAPMAGASSLNLASPATGLSKDVLSLAECVQIALNQNPAQLAARHGITVATETVGIAKAPYYPEVNFISSWSRSQRSSTLPGGVTQLLTPDSNGPTNDWLAGFAARYTIADGGRRAAELRRTLALKGATEEDAKRVRQDIVFEVQSSFYRQAAATQVHSVAEENLSRAKAHLDLAQRLKEAGAVPKADVLRADVEVAEAELSLARAAGLTRTTRGQLSIAMGLPAASRFKIDAEDQKLASPVLADPEIMIEEALYARPEINAGLQYVSADQAGVAAAKSAYRPRLYADAGYDYHSDSFPPKGEEWSVALNLSWTIFSGFSRKHEVNRARAELSRQEAEVQQLILQVQQEVWAAYSTVLETWESVETTESQVASALDSMRAASTRYEVGAATINDLLDAQTALARAETNRAETVWNYLIADAWLDRVRGKNSAAYS
ncbi:MAG: hypothetical protein AMXMBFR84_27690 [Candidatus Hydrogenedentota bacterium]